LHSTWLAPARDPRRKLPSHQRVPRNPTLSTLHAGEFAVFNAKRARRRTSGLEERLSPAWRATIARTSMGVDVSSERVAGLKTSPAWRATIARTGMGVDVSSERAVGLKTSPAWRATIARTGMGVDVSSERVKTPDRGVARRLIVGVNVGGERGEELDVSSERGSGVKTPDGGVARRLIVGVDIGCERGEEQSSTLDDWASADSLKTPDGGVVRRLVVGVNIECERGGEPSSRLDKGMLLDLDDWASALRQNALLTDGFTLDENPDLEEEVRKLSLFDLDNDDDGFL